jgi:hypothetical protein
LLQHTGTTNQSVYKVSHINIYMIEQNRPYTIASIGENKFHSNIAEILPKNTHHFKYGVMGEFLGSIRDGLSMDPNYVVFVQNEDTLEYLKQHNKPILGKRIIHVGGFGNSASAKEKLSNLLEDLPNELPIQGNVIQLRQTALSNKPQSLLSRIGLK